MPASVTSNGTGRNSPVIDGMGPMDRAAPRIPVYAGSSSSRSGDQPSRGGGVSDVGGENSSNPGSQGGERWSRQDGNSERDNGQSDRWDGNRDRENGGRGWERMNVGETSGRSRRNNGSRPGTRAEREQIRLYRTRVDELMSDPLRGNEGPVPSLGMPQRFARYPAYNSPADFRVGGRSRVAQFGSGRDDDIDREVDLDPVDPPPAADDEVAAWYRTRMPWYRWSSVSDDLAGVGQNPAMVPGNHQVAMADDTEEEWYRMRRGEQAMYHRLSAYDQYVDYLRSQERR